MKLSQKVGCAVLVLIALLSLSCSAMAVVKTLHFVDAKDHWAEEIIEALAEKEVVKGYDDGKCHPDELVTRGQFSALLARYFNYKATGDISGFSDVKGHWAEDAISGLVGAGIVSVKEYEGIYRPDEHMTRIEMVYMIDRALGFEEVAKADKSRTTFTDDASISSIHKGYLNEAAPAGLMKTPSANEEMKGRRNVKRSDFTSLGAKRRLHYFILLHLIHRPASLLPGRLFYMVSR